MTQKLQPVELDMWFFIKAGFGLAVGFSAYLIAFKIIYGLVEFIFEGLL